MRPVGFSTGALAFGDFERGLDIVRREALDVVELSALREPELAPLVRALDHLDLSLFSHVGFHAPSAIDPSHEAEVVARLEGVAARGWPVIVHPDVITDTMIWSALGPQLCLENMDRRKPTGRTVGELEALFEVFPDASFCLDLGHARQVDPSMTEAYLLLEAFDERLVQIHLSEVTTASKHERLSWGTIHAMRHIAHRIRPELPIILESVISETEVEAEVMRARRALTAQGSRVAPQREKHPAILPRSSSPPV